MISIQISVTVCTASPWLDSFSLVQVSRFLVVHGQIILNQFKNFPVKQIQRCAFVGQLQKQMEARRHSRLYLSKRKITAEMRVGRKLNPMRDRTAKSKPTPMTATATNLVKSVWMNYFGGSSPDNQGVYEVGIPAVQLSPLSPPPANPPSRSLCLAVSLSSAAYIVFQILCSAS